MRALAAIAVAAVLAALLEASFLSVLPRPIADVRLPLILVVMLVAVFRFREAYVAAAVAGITADAFSALPFGTNAAVAVAVTAVAVALFTRVFTNRSLPGVIGINAAAYLCLSAAIGAVAFASSVYEGAPARLDAAAVAVAAFYGLVAQLAATAVLMFLWRRAARIFSSFFLIR